MLTTDNNKINFHDKIQQYGFPLFNLVIILWAVLAFLVGSGHEVMQVLTPGDPGGLDVKYGTLLGLFTIGLTWFIGNLLLTVLYLMTRPDEQQPATF